MRSNPVVHVVYLLLGGDLDAIEAVGRLDNTKSPAGSSQGDVCHAAVDLDQIRASEQHPENVLAMFPRSIGSAYIFIVECHFELEGLLGAAKVATELLVLSLRELKELGGAIPVAQFTSSPVESTAESAWG